MTGQTEPPRVSQPLAVAQDAIGANFQLAPGFQDNGNFPEREQPRNVREGHGTGGAGHLDHLQILKLQNYHRGMQNRISAIIGNIDPRYGAKGFLVSGSLDLRSQAVLDLDRLLGTHVPGMESEIIHDSVPRKGRDLTPIRPTRHSPKQEPLTQDILVFYCYM